MSGICCFYKLLNRTSLLAAVPWLFFLFWMQLWILRVMIQEWTCFALIQKKSQWLPLWCWETKTTFPCCALGWSDVEISNDLGNTGIVVMPMCSGYKMLVVAASFVQKLFRMAKANCTQDHAEIFMCVTLCTPLSKSGMDETEGAEPLLRKWHAKCYEMYQSRAIFLTRVVFSSGQGKAGWELVVVVREDGWKKANFKEIPIKHIPLFYWQLLAKSDLF